MRVYIAGQRQFGAAVYELAKALGCDVAGVSAPMLDSTGELPDRLRRAAQAGGTPVLPPGALNADTLPADVDLIIAAHSHDFIGRKTRLRARLGGIGYHPSLLPRHRGRDAIRWAIHMGDPVTGGTVYWLSEAVDGGDIAAQDFCWIRPGESPERLWRDTLAPLGLRLFEAVIRDLQRGVIRRQPQDEAVATWEPSWGRAPLARPDLELLGHQPGFTVERKAARAA